MPLGYEESPAQRGCDSEPDQTMLRTKVAPNDRPLVREKPRLIVTDIGSPPSVKLTMGMRVGSYCPARKGRAAQLVQPGQDQPGSTSLTASSVRLSTRTIRPSTLA